MEWWNDGMMGQARGKNGILEQWKSGRMEKWKMNNGIRKN